MKKLVSLILLLTCVLMPTLTVQAAQTPSGIPFSELESQIDVLMNEHIGTSAPGAAIVVVYEGEIIFSRGYGYADIENRIPVDPAVTVFEHASINKAFVWVAVMQLVEQGLLNLDVDVATYLPDAFVFEMPFTMRDLLNHAAGFADILLGFVFDDEEVPTLKNALLDSQPVQLFTPGTVSAYSNWGTALAAFVVSQISGQDFVVYERENIFLPSNMYNTLNLPDWFGNDSFLANRAQGYLGDRNGTFSEAAFIHASIYPTGSSNGTVEDLAAFIKALTPPTGESGPLFEHTETIQTLFSPSSLDPYRPGMHHGFLPFPGVFPGIGHGGNLPGFTTEFVIVPELQFGFALLTNVGEEWYLIPAIRQLLLGNPPTPTIGNNLPNAQAVEGRFITTKRFGGTFVEFLSFAGMGGLPHARVSALDENRIFFDLAHMGQAVFVQTAPYVFQIYDPTEAPFLALFFQELRFMFEDGVPTHMVVKGLEDFTALPVGRTMPFLIASLVGVIVSIVFFLVAPIVLFILFLVRRKKQNTRTRFDYFTTGFLLLGTLLMLNNLVLFGLFGINPFRTVIEVAPFIWINYILAGLVGLLLIGSIWSWRIAGEESTKRKVLFVITAVCSVLFIAVLHNWNFFVLL